MKIKLELTSDGIAVSTEKKWVYAPLKWWKKDPFGELIRMFHLLRFDLKIKKGIKGGLGEPR